MAVDLSEFNLTKKQELWVLDYCSNGFNGVKASRAAGYKGNYTTLATTGSENLLKPAIKAAMKKVFATMVMSQEEALTRLGAMAKGKVPTKRVIKDGHEETETYDTKGAIDSLLPSRLELTGKDGGPVEVDHTAEARGTLAHLINSQINAGEQEDMDGGSE